MNLIFFTGLFRCTINYQVKLLLKLNFLIILFFNSALAFANPCAKILHLGEQAFCELYIPHGSCLINTIHLIKAYQHLPEFNINEAKLLIFYNQHYPSLGLSIHGFEARASYRDGKKMENWNPSHWGFHAVLEYQGLIYDLDFKSSFTPLHPQVYLEQMFLTPKTDAMNSKSQLAEHLEDNQDIRVIEFNANEIYNGTTKLNLTKEQFSEFNLKSKPLEQFLKTQSL